MAVGALYVLVTAGLVAHGCLGPGCLDDGPAEPVTPIAPTLEGALPEVPVSQLSQGIQAIEGLVLVDLLRSGLPGPASQLQAEATDPSGTGWTRRPSSAQVLGDQGVSPQHDAEGLAVDHDVRTADPGPEVSAHPVPTASLQAQGHGTAALPSGVVAGALAALAAMALYHRLSKEEVLSHEARIAILDHLAHQPGLTAGELAGRLGCCYRTARHHLEKLAAFDLVAAHQAPVGVRWHLPGDASSLRPALADSQAAVLELLEDEPGLHLSAIARQADMAKATVKHSLDRLVELGYVEDRRVGPLRCFEPVAGPSQG